MSPLYWTPRRRKKPAVRRAEKKEPFEDSPATDQTLSLPGLLVGMNELLESRGETFRVASNLRANRYNQLKRRVEADVATQCRLQGMQAIERAFFVFTYREATRRRDMDNIAGSVKKMVLDGLVHARILPNDNWASIAGWIDRFEAGTRYPGVWIRMIRPGSPETDQKIVHAVNWWIQVEVLKWKSNPMGGKQPHGPAVNPLSVGGQDEPKK